MARVKQHKYKQVKSRQRSIYLPIGMSEVFRTFVPGKASTEVRGAILLDMALADMPDVREKAVRLANRIDWLAVDLSKIPAELPPEVQELREYLFEAVSNRMVAQCINRMSPDEKAKLLSESDRKARRR